MNNTPDTPLQLPDDDRVLLRQIALTCRDLAGQVKDLREEVKDLREEVKDLREEVKDLREEVKDLREQVQTVNSRLDAMEGNRDTVGKLDRLILAVAEVQQDMQEVKERLGKIETEMKNVRRYARTSIGELTREQDELEDRVTRLEERSPQS